MNYIVVAIIAYLLIALGVVIDKFLLSSKRVSHPAIYAFYSGILSFFTIFIFAPFGFHWTNLTSTIGMALVGLVFFAGMVSIFYAIKKGEASRVVPLVGVIIPLISLLIEGVIFRQPFSAQEILGIIILVFGGFLISFDLPLEIGKKKFFAGFFQAILAGFFLAIAYLGFDYFSEIYKDDGFSNVFIWTRFGLTLGSILILIIPAWRKIILKSIFGAKKQKSKNLRTANLFFLNKILNGTGSALINYAIFLGSATIVNALISVEYVFVFIVVAIFHAIFPKIFAERNKLSDILQKVIAILVVAVGIVFITI